MSSIGHTTLCPTCTTAVVIDWDRTDFDARPQRLGIVCPSCGFRTARVAPAPPHGDGQFWRAARLRCRICSHEEAAVFPFGADESNIQCSNCEHMTSEPID
jgi:transcription elongation factor Elf1